jgi:hypothetical protein
LGSVLIIDVSQDLPLGTYQFNIGVCAVGADLGLFPLTITVVNAPTVALPLRQQTILSYQLTHTMAGSVTNFEINQNGTFLFIRDQGLRFPSVERPATRTWSTGKLSDAELSVLIQLVRTGGFDMLNPSYTFPGRPAQGGPPGAIANGDMILNMAVNLPGLFKSVSAFVYISPDNDRSFPDMPAALNQVYSALAALMDRATVIAQQNI